MCARFSQAVPSEQMERLFEFPIPADWTPRYNVAPTQSVVVLTQPTDRKEWSRMGWGLLPPQSKDGQRYVNARAETVLEKSTFRNCYLRRRCLVPVTSFFEWKTVSLQPTFDLFGDVEPPKSGKKVPYAFGVLDEPVFFLAGIWDTCRAPSGELQNTFSVLTTEPNPLVGEMHDRMPVIIPLSDFPLWFGTDEDARRMLMVPMSEQRMWRQRVSSDLNNPRNDRPELLRPIADGIE